MSSSKSEKHRHEDERKHRRDDRKYESKHESKKECRDESEKSFKEYSRAKDEDVAQDANQVNVTDQESDELIFIKDSCNICVHTTDTQAAVSLQVALQLAITLVIRITILDSDKGQSVSEELLQHFNSEQMNKQKIWIENSKDINVTTTDTDISVNVQALLQVLAALVAKVDVA
ncbi:MAG: spore coat protein [Bacillota bacterium]|nr:spore coat protein [Bacillota bacterium]